MLRISRSTPVMLVALGSLLAFSAAAQGPQKPAADAQPAGPPAAGAPTGGAPTGGDSTADNLPVLAVTSLEVVRTTHAPTLDIIVARGLTSTDGWSDATLLPLTHGSPSDGVLDLVLTADPPKAGGPGPAPIHAVFPLGQDHPYKAIRVRSATNVILMKSLPGFAEMKLIPWACGPCVGKLFVAKGAALPAGASAGDVVREEDLPVHTRLIRPNDGVGDMHANPNRLTVVIGEDGRIVDSSWE